MRLTVAVRVDNERMTVVAGDRHCGARAVVQAAASASRGDATNPATVASTSTKRCTAGDAIHEEWAACSGVWSRRLRASGPGAWRVACFGRQHAIPDCTRRERRPSSSVGGTPAVVFGNAAAFAAKRPDSKVSWWIEAVTPL